MQVVNSAGIYFIRFWNSDLLPPKRGGAGFGSELFGSEFFTHWKCRITGMDYPYSMGWFFLC